LAEFCRRFGLSTSQYANYETGRGIASAPVIRLLKGLPGLTGSWIFTGRVRGLDLATAKLLGERQAFLDGLAADLAELAEGSDGERKAAYEHAVACLIKDGARPAAKKRGSTHKVALAGSPALILTSIIIWEIIEHLLGIAYAIPGG
jgi:transcriptional regulator with XRE-family HTH domain